LPAASFLASAVTPTAPSGAEKRILPARSLSTSPAPASAAPPIRRIHRFSRSSRASLRSTVLDPSCSGRAHPATSARAKPTAPAASTTQCTGHRFQSSSAHRASTAAAKRSADPPGRSVGRAR